MKKNFLAAAVTGAVLVSAPASAAVVASIGDGQTFCESRNNSVFTAADCDLGGNADLSNDMATNDALTFLGEGVLGGFVADGPGVGNGNYPDWANITLSEDSFITMRLINPDSMFDAAFTFGGIVAEVLNATATSVTFRADAGTYLFGINATEPSDSATRLASSYAFEVSSVPLPASAFLLLAGLGGLAASKRKRA